MCRRQDFRSVRVQCAIVDVLHFCVSRQVSQHRCSRWQVGEHGQEPEAIVRCWYKHCRQGPQTSSVRTQSLSRPQPQDYHRTAYAFCNLPHDDVPAWDALETSLTIGVTFCHSERRLLTPPKPASQFQIYTAGRRRTSMARRLRMNKANARVIYWMRRTERYEHVAVSSHSGFLFCMEKQWERTDDLPSRN